MSSAAQPTVERADIRTIVGGGIKLGVLTTVGVVAFALVSRALAGTVEIVVQSAFVVAGGVVFSYLPSFWVKPRSADGIAWTALVGLLGALTFTVLDVAVLRPAHVYHWTWDQLGGGSGFWYLPVWWMGSAFLAWFGGMVVGALARGGREPNPLFAGLQTAGLGVVVFAILALLRVGPFHSAMAALGFTIALIVHAGISGVMHKK